VISAAHATWNGQSKRVLEKLAMKFLRENPCGFIKNNKPVAEFEDAVTREEWSKRSGNVA
jgi:hypothetical protein